MQAYAEGFEILHASEYPLDLAAVAEAWMHGTVIRSWLLELLGRAFAQHGEGLGDIRGWVADSGEGRWTVQEAHRPRRPAPVITLVADDALPEPPGRELRRARPGGAAQAVRRPRHQDRRAELTRLARDGNARRDVHGARTTVGTSRPRGAQRERPCLPTVGRQQPEQPAARRDAPRARARAVRHRRLRRDRRPDLAARSCPRSTTCAARACCRPRRASSASRAGR